MKKKEVFWHIICFNSYKFDNSHEIKNFLESENLKNICKNLEEKTVIVIGWDWTMLKAIKQNYKLWLPFLWINYWNKWFLLNDKDYIKSNSKYKKILYPIMETEVFLSWNVYNDIFLNEININAGWWKIIDLDIFISNKGKLNIKWDWIVISTSLGSTWYNSSLRWAIISHNLEVLAITPKAPWLPIWQNSIIVSNNEEINIKNTWRNSILEVYCDWRKLFSSDQSDIKIIIKKSEIKATFLIESSYWEIWDNKIYL